VIDSLKRQGLIEVSDESIVLSNFAIEKFEASGDDYPRFTKVESRRDTVTFDLLSFTPLPSKSNSLLNENVIRLSASDDFIGSSVDFAKAAYYKRFPEIARMNDGLKKDAINVYSVEDIQSKKRGYLPIPVSFSLNQEGQINRYAEESFEEGAPPELVEAFHEQVSEVFPPSQKADIGAFEQFVDSFDLPFLWKYVMGKSFDLYRYASDLKSGAVLTPKGVRPLFGNLYLPHNAENLVRRIKSQRTDSRRRFLLTDVGWLAPDHEFWGRGEAYQQAAHDFSSALAEKSLNDCHLFACAEPGQEPTVGNVLKVPEIRNLHFFRPATVGDPTMMGRLELFLYPTGFVAALYHLSIPGNSGQWAPVGFVSSLPKHTETAHRLFELSAGGPNYSGQLQDRRNPNGPIQNPRFSDACGFLYFSDLSVKSPSVVEDDE
jgi:hypothetical protein